MFLFRKGDKFHHHYYTENMDDESIHILADIGPRAKYGELGVKGGDMVNKKSYLSLLGRLKGFGDINSPEAQSITTTISGQSGDEGDVLNAMLVGILERHQIGGGFFEYPRIFLVGPDQISGSPTKHEQMPYLRDVDRIVWIGKYPVGTVRRRDHYYLGYIDVSNEDYSSVDTVNAKSGYFVFHGDPPTEDVDNVLKKIRDGDEWDLGKIQIQESLNKYSLGGSDGGSVSPLNQVLVVGWIAQMLTRERLLPSPRLMMKKAQEVLTMDAMLATAMIGTVNFNTATELDNQQLYETSLGYLTPEKLRIVYVGLKGLRSGATTTANRIGIRISERDGHRKKNHGRITGDEKDSTSSPPILHRIKHSPKKIEGDDLIARTLSKHARISEGLDHLGRWIVE